jgi:hypothetical protein
MSRLGSVQQGEVRLGREGQGEARPGAAGSFFFAPSPIGDVAAESERPGVLPVAPAARPDALAALCQALGLEFLALAEARRGGEGWDDGHWRRLRGAVEAAGVALDAGPRPG